MQVETHDSKGRPVCGQDFMAGTICSDAPGHDGGCSATCQTCGGDWINQTCTCYHYCPECGAMFDDTKLTAYCVDCRCHQGETIQCLLFWDHREVNPPTYPTACRGFPKSEPVKPVTDEEIAEVFGLSLPLQRDTP